MNTHNEAFQNSLRCLQHPLSLASVAILLLNDHVFKLITPSWITGKLSDLAGLFFFPLIIAAGLSILLSTFNLKLRSIGILAFAVVTIWFVLFKTTTFVNGASVTLISTFLGHPVQLLIDPSDTLALISLLPSWNLWIHVSETKNPRAGYLSLILAVLASLATSPAMPQVEVVTHLLAENDRVIAFDVKNGTVAVSEDGGRNWEWRDASTVSEFPTETRVLPLVTCLPSQQNECYRINGQKMVEVSIDGGETWEVSWQLPTDRISYLRRINPDLDLGPYDMVIISWQDQDYVLVAAGEEGLLRKEGSGGEWERIPLGNATPTPYRSMNFSDTLSVIWIELLIWFFLSIITFIVACWIVWVWNSKTSERDLSKRDWIFSPALSPLLGIFLTLFVLIIMGLVFNTVTMITGFSSSTNTLLIIFTLCVLIALGLLPVTIHRRLNNWKLILIKHGYRPTVAERIVLTSYFAHVFVFVAGALVWLSWTLDIISRYSLAMVSALICTGLIAMFFLKKIENLSTQRHLTEKNKVEP